jgi:branched-chain amino acid transport system substrate-binding protein
MRLSLPATLFLATSLAAATALGAGPELAKLSIGTIFPMTGPQAAFGREALKGVDLALDVARTKDPTLAARVVVVQGDDMSTAKDATTAATQLLDKDRVHALLGSFAAAPTVAAAEIARKRLTPIVVPFTTQTAPTPGGSVFRASLDDGMEGMLLAQFALKTLGAKTAATLRDDSVVSRTFTARFAEAFTAGGGKIVLEEVYALGTDDFTLPVKHLEESGATVVATPAAWPAAAAVLKQARKLNYRATFLGPDSWDTTSFNQAAGPAAIGHYFVTHFSVDDPDPATQEFVAAFKTKYGRAPGVLAASTYDATGLLLDALKRGNSNLKGLLTGSLARTRDFAGATGLISLSENGGWTKTGVIKATTATGATFKARIAAATGVPAAPAAPGQVNSTTTAAPGAPAPASPGATPAAPAAPTKTP